MITIVNCHYQTPDHYCGREYKGYPASALRNRFIEGVHGNLHQVVERFARDLWKRVQAHEQDVLDELRVIVELEKSRGAITLGCWHNTRPCHVERIIAAVRSEQVLAILDEWMPF